MPSLTPDQVDDLLGRDVVAHLATLDADGYPHVTPLWFIWDGSRFRMTSLASRPHLARLRANPRAGLVVDVEAPDRGDGERPNRQIRAVGEATVDPDHDRIWTGRIRRKYGISVERPSDVLGPRCVITLRPQRWLAIGSVQGRGAAVPPSRHPYALVVDPDTALGAWRSVVGEARLEPMERVHNPLWRVTGEDGREWVLKRLPEYPPGAGPVEEFRVLCYLQAAGLPVATPIITDSGLIAFNADNLSTGSTDKQPTGKHAYSLLPLLPNDAELRESPALAWAIGAGIGRLDQVLSRCPWQVTSFTDDPAREILRERYPSLRGELRRLIDPLRDRLHAAIVGLPTQRTHGDCNVGNVLTQDGAVTGYIDLDHLPTGPRVYDLSKYLVSRLNAHADHGRPDAMIAVLRHYVAGYQATYPVSERELTAVVPLMLAVAIGNADWYAHGWAADPLAYQRELRTIELLTRRYEAVVGAAIPGAS